MPEMPEIQAHAERLTAEFGGRVLTKFTPFNFTALKTAVPAPDTAYGEPLRGVGRRGKYLLLDFGETTFVDPPHARRAAARRRQAEPEAARRTGPVHLRAVGA